MAVTRHLWQERIVADPKVHHGDPCVRGTRIPVAMILGSLADGMSAHEILREYPQLSQDDVRAALEYAAEVVHHEVLIPFVGQD